MPSNFNPDWGSVIPGIAQAAGGIFGNSGKPYDKAMEQYMQWAQRGQNVQQPFYNAGTGAIGDYQNWLQTQKDPTKFINDIMGQYSESPYAKYMQQQSMNAGQNAASASGLMGSTPLMNQLQQNAANISSQDQNQWLQNVLGINTQYGAGQNNLINTGQNSANSLTDMYNRMSQQMGEQAYNRGASKNNNFWNMLGGGLSILGSFL